MAVLGPSGWHELRDASGSHGGLGLGVPGRFRLDLGGDQRRRDPGFGGGCTDVFAVLLRDASSAATGRNAPGVSGGSGLVQLHEYHRDEDQQPHDGGCCAHL
ncbi:hypothetical protein ACFFX0_32575 [Citricoccus parietis]|uniref:Uncharacterized protein n=1 Tax=Citricoccus parietis TaxID=592307 RepID=A0ABV5G9N5_9MICC